ncbi:Dual specificity protein phosphatase 10 [Acromyrmex echinatior]|uniref:Dual specificity protein phosphatase 10 n=1 Tax=Acromyrmex echinatior TaxID=103372 RepID=F4WQE6_ACREC|nr:Dual specificity protein phosphatase 10 [Acromyrmex echinatior]
MCEEWTKFIEVGRTYMKESDSGWYVNVNVKQEVYRFSLFTHVKIKRLCNDIDIVIKKSAVTLKASSTERSPKRAIVLELKSSSNGISGQLSSEEISEMPVLTRVCSSATLPRLKRFRFRPIDVITKDLCSLSMSAEARSKHNRSDMKRNKRKSRITRPAASVGASIDQGSCTSDKLESSAYEDTTVYNIADRRTVPRRKHYRRELQQSPSPSPPSSLRTQSARPSASRPNSIVLLDVYLAMLRASMTRSLSEPGPSPCAFPAPTTTSSIINNNNSNNNSTEPPSIVINEETASLPTSPCSENGLHRQLVLSKTRVITADDLAQRLVHLERSSAVPVILDCRPFTLYNVNHVRGAINVTCSDRFNRRRLQLGKATLADLASAREGKELLRKRQFKEVIVYDEGTDDLEHLTAQNPLFLVLAALVDDDREPAVLIAKYDSCAIKYSTTDSGKIMVSEDILRTDDPHILAIHLISVFCSSHQFHVFSIFFFINQQDKRLRIRRASKEGNADGEIRSNGSRGCEDDDDGDGDDDDGIVCSSSARMKAKGGDLFIGTILFFLLFSNIFFFVIQQRAIDVTLVIVSGYYIISNDSRSPIYETKHRVARFGEANAKSRIKRDFSLYVQLFLVHVELFYVYTQQVNGSWNRVIGLQLDSLCVFAVFFLGKSSKIQEINI